MVQNTFGRPITIELLEKLQKLEENKQNVQKNIFISKFFNKQNFVQKNHSHEHIIFF